MEEGLPIPPKKETATSGDGLPVPPVKKKVETSPSPSVSEGGTSGLTATPSVSPNTPTETYTVKQGASFDPFSKAPEQVQDKTVLGNKQKPSNELKPIQTATGGLPYAADSELAKNQAKAQHDIETKSMIGAYDKYKQNRANEQVSLGVEPLALDDNKNTMDFYLHHLKETNPEEYNYTTEKQAELSKKGDKLEEHRFHAELVDKALALKTRVMSGKTDIASNALRDNYGDVMKSLNENSEKANQTATKIQGIDDFIKQNYQTDENGQIIVNPVNKKEVDDLLNKRTEFINEYNGYAKLLEEIQNNDDFKNAVSLLDETQKSYDALEQLYTDVKNNDPDAFKKLPAYREQLLKEQQAQFSKDLSEKITGGDLGIMEATGRGVTGMASSLSFIPKSFTSNNKYGWTDKFYDSVKNTVDDFDAENNPLPTGYDKPVYENGQWNLKYLPGKIAGTITEMAPIMAITLATEGATGGLLARMGVSGELSTTLGSFAGEYVTVADDFYSKAKKAGMSEGDAMAFSRSAATTQALIGSLSPDIKLARNNAFKEGLDTYASQIAKGVSKKEAVKEAAKGFSEKLIKEVPQENLQTLAEIHDKNNMYEKMGLTDKIQQSVSKDIIETTILSSIVTLGLGAGAIKTPSRMQQESLYMAASQPEELVNAAQKLLNAGKITQEQFNDVTMKVAKANFALSKMDKSLPAEKKIKMLVPLMEKIDLKEEAAKLDDSQKELMNEKISKKDAEIKGIVSSLSDEELQSEADDQAFLSSIKAEHEKELSAKTAKETIPAEENKMQKEGMIELDESQKSQPIELSTKPENVITTPGEIIQEPTNETTSVDDKVAELEKAIKENKQNFFNEKIDHVTYRKNNDALEADLLKLQQPQVAEKTTENDKENITGIQGGIRDGEKPIEVKPNEETSTEQASTSGILQTQGRETETQKVEPVKKTATQISAEQQMQEDEDVIEPAGKEDADTVKKMNDDAELMKNFSRENYSNKTDAELKDLVQKKYVGSLERAYKAKIDGRISGPTYTEYRNKLNDIVTGKLSEYSEKKTKTGGKEGESLRKGELKAQVSALGEKVKEKLLGQGFKNVALSSGVPVTPKMIEDLVNLTVKGIHLGIDLGYGAREATDRALKAIKNHPRYQQISKAAGFDEKQFKSTVEKEFSKVKSEASVEKVEPVKSTETVKAETESNKETVGATEKETETGGKKTTESNKEIEVPVNGKGERKGAKRLRETEKYKEVFSRVSEEAKSYDKMDLKEAILKIKEKIKEFEDAGTLEQLAKTLLDEEKKSPFPDRLNHPGMIYVMDRLNNLADNEQNKSIKESLYDLSARLSEKAIKDATTAGQTLAAMALSAELMPSSKAGMRTFTKSHVESVQKSYMKSNDLKILPESVNELNSLSESEEAEKVRNSIKEEAKKMAMDQINSIAESIKGKEWVKSVSDVIKMAKEKSPENC